MFTLLLCLDTYTLIYLIIVTIYIKSKLYEYIILLLLFKFYNYDITKYILILSYLFLIFYILL
jgi:hypothetical protein